MVLAGRHEVRKGGIDVSLERLELILVVVRESRELALVDGLHIAVDLLDVGNDRAGYAEDGGGLLGSARSGR